MFVRRFGVVVVAGTLGLLAAAVPAAAHAELIASYPAAGAAEAVAPTHVELTFNEAVTLGAEAVSVLGPDGVRWAVQPPTVSGAVVRAPVVPTGPAGEYTVVYNVISSDGDPVAGSVRFTLAAAVPTTTTTTTTTSAAPERAAAPVEDSGVPLWVWLAGALVAVAALMVVVLRVRRR